MLVPLDPKNGFKPVPKKDRQKWIEDEDGDAGPVPLNKPEDNGGKKK